MLLRELEITRRADGSIDTEHYVLIARSERSRAATNCFARLRRIGDRLRSYPTTFEGPVCTTGDAHSRARATSFTPSPA